MAKTSLSDLQKQMIDFLIDNDQAVEQQIISQGNISNQTRLNIYKNAYQVRLKEVIDNDHQMLGMYLGDALFEQMATEYVQGYPSNYTSLRYYADRLPQFLATHSPFDQHPIIAELAKFERLLLVAFDAADATLFNQETLQGISHQQWPALVFHLHPSVQLLHLNWSAVETWQALKRESTPQPAINKQSCWLLWRNSERLTEFRSLSEQESALMQMIGSGESFSALCDFLLISLSADEVNKLVSDYLTSWLEQGLFSIEARA